MEVGRGRAAVAHRYQPGIAQRHLGALVGAATTVDHIRVIDTLRCPGTERAEVRQRPVIDNVDGVQRAGTREWRDRRYYLNRRWPIGQRRVERGLAGGDKRIAGEDVDILFLLHLVGWVTSRVLWRLSLNKIIRWSQDLVSIVVVCPDRATRVARWVVRAWGSEAVQRRVLRQVVCWRWVLGVAHRIEVDIGGGKPIVAVDLHEGANGVVAHLAGHQRGFEAVMSAARWRQHLLDNRIAIGVARDAVGRSLPSLTGIGIE